MKSPNIRDLLRYHLGRLPSFLIGRHRWDYFPHELFEQRNFLSAIVGADCIDSVAGVYVNSTEFLDCLIFTNTGIHVVRHDTARFVAYTEMVSVAEPTNVDQDLDIKLESGDYVALPCVGSSETSSDVFELYECLTEIIGQKHRYVLNLLQVEDQKSFVNLLAETSRQYKYEEVNSFFDNDLPVWIDKLMIDQKLLQDKQVWRLLALIALMPEFQK